MQKAFSFQQIQIRAFLHRSILQQQVYLLLTIAILSVTEAGPRQVLANGQVVGCEHRRLMQHGKPLCLLALLHVYRAQQITHGTTVFKVRQLPFQQLLSLKVAVKLHQHLGLRHQVGKLTWGLLAGLGVILQRQIGLLPALIDDAAEIVGFRLARRKLARNRQFLVGSFKLVAFHVDPR